MDMDSTQIDHVNYPKRLRNKSLAELYFIIKDAKETIRVNPEGHKAGYYQDEINYACNEIQRRRVVG